MKLAPALLLTVTDAKDYVFGGKKGMQRGKPTGRLHEKTSGVGAHIRCQPLDQRLVLLADGVRAAFDCGERDQASSVGSARSRRDSVHSQTKLDGASSVIVSTAAS